jgi:hypothetical protein
VSSETDGRIVGVIGTCSAGGCRRPAVHHVDLETGGGRLVGVVCERCARVTSAALFLLRLIA